MCSCLSGNMIIFLPVTTRPAASVDPYSSGSEHV